jgi:type II secretory pathway pseudopilin PulG
MRLNRGRNPHRRGFTVLEMTVVVLLMVFISMLVASIWSNFGGPSSRTSARIGLTREAQLALQMLSRDLDGRLDNPAPADQSPYSLVGRIPSASAPSWRVLQNSAPLQLCYDAGTTPDGVADWGANGGVDTVVTYTFQGDALVRTVENGGPTTVVARQVQAFEVTPLSNQGAVDQTGRWARVDLTFQNGSLQRVYRMVFYGP